MPVDNDRNPPAFGGRKRSQWKLYGPLSMPRRFYAKPVGEHRARKQDPVEMRDCMAPLIALGEETGTTFLVICHTNKRKGAYGRDRIADSADLWDISRSVIMAGYTESQGVRYLSNEKNNYEQLQETMLFSIDGAGQIVREGTSWKRDKEYMLDAVVAKSTPKREDCRDFILRTLDAAQDHCMKSDDLVRDAENHGHSYSTFRRARDELKKDNAIEFYSTGSAKKKDRVWYTRIKESDTELSFVDEESGRTIEVEVIDDSPEAISAWIASIDVISPRSFSYEKEMKALAHLSYEKIESGFQNTSPVSSLSRDAVLEKAKAECTRADYNVYSISYDQESKMWKVEFGISWDSYYYEVIYINNNGLTQLVATRPYPEAGEELLPKPSEYF